MTKTAGSHLNSRNQVQRCFTQIAPQVLDSYELATSRSCEGSPRLGERRAARGAGLQKNAMRRAARGAEDYGRIEGFAPPANHKILWSSAERLQDVPRWPTAHKTTTSRRELAIFEIPLVKTGSSGALSNWQSASYTAARRSQAEANWRLHRTTSLNSSIAASQ